MSRPGAPNLHWLMICLSYIKFSHLWVCFSKFLFCSTGDRGNLIHCNSFFSTRVWNHLRDIHICEKCGDKNVFVLWQRLLSALGSLCMLLFVWVMHLNISFFQNLLVFWVRPRYLPAQCTRMIQPSQHDATWQYLPVIWQYLLWICSYFYHLTL